MSDEEYTEFVIRIKARYRQSGIKTAVKINTALLEFYWELGREISALRAAAKWGAAFFDNLSLDLKHEFPAQSGFSATNLKYVRRWYLFYNAPQQIVTMLVTILICPLISDLYRGDIT